MNLASLSPVESAPVSSSNARPFFEATLSVGVARLSEDAWQVARMHVRLLLTNASLIQLTTPLLSRPETSIGGYSYRSSLVSILLYLIKERVPSINTIWTYGYQRT